MSSEDMVVVGPFRPRAKWREFREVESEGEEKLPHSFTLEKLCRYTPLKVLAEKRNE